MPRGLRLAPLLIPITALIVITPLILNGCSCGHDFDFHLVSWFEAAAQFNAGNLHLSWAFSPAWNAGEPRFVFYPPLSWTLGAVLGLMLPWTAVPIVFTWIALTASGFSMYFLMREVFASETNSAVSLIAAVVYLSNPYMLFTAYERTAYAELLAAAWIPLLLTAILCERVTVPRISIPVALLWLTNAPAAVMGCYALALLVVIRLVWISVRMRREFRSAWRQCCRLSSQAIGGLALGLGTAAFYIVPAAYERRWVQISMATITGMRIADNFLFHRTGDAPHDAVLHTASVIAVIVLAASVIALAIAAARLGSDQNQEKSVLDRRRFLLLSFSLLVLAIGLMLSPLSSSVWRIAPEMTFLQFPWRLVAVLAAAMSAAIGLATYRLRLSAPLTLATLVLVAAISLPATRTFRQACDDEDTVSARLAVFGQQAGTDPTDEYTPGDADNEALARDDPPFWLADDGDAPAPHGAASPALVPRQMTIHTEHPEMLILNLRDYPAWQIRIDGRIVRERTQRADGLIAVPVPVGNSNVVVTYIVTPDRRLGDGISLGCVCGLLGWGVLASLRRPPLSRMIVS